jgi:D-alanyl-D-alanine carboxypeptidase
VKAFLLLAALSSALLASGADQAFARGHHRKGGHARAIMPASLTDPAKDAALIVDGATGKVLYARNATAERHPASLTKMMTLYLLFEALKKGQVTFTTPLPVSAHAAAQKPTKLHLYAGDTIPVEAAIYAIVIRSANDVAVTIAEALGGTEGNFATMMNTKARQLGMRDTFYHNASGLPDPLQISTASDLAVLARHVAYDFPQYFHFFAAPGFSYRGMNYTTHDNLIGRYNGADGIKTGYTGASGFNLVSSVTRGRTHIIGVVMGGRTAHRRDTEMENLLDNAFAQVQQNPNLVASATVPWRTMAQNTTSYDLTPPGSGQIIALPQQSSDPEDEEAAETLSDRGDNEIAPPPAAVPVVAQAKPPAPAAPAIAQPQLQSPTPKPALVAQANIPVPKPKPFIAAPAKSPAAGPAIATNIPAPKPRPVMLASYQPPKPKPAMHPEIGEGDIGDDTFPTAKLKAQDWTIQIGAYADGTMARAQLASYAERSMDIVGQASRIVVPFKAVDGHTLFRARFGPFAEREAREVCSRLTERGQTCFAALATR